MVSDLKKARRSGYAWSAASWLTPKYPCQGNIDGKFGGKSMENLWTSTENLFKNRTEEILRNLCD